MAPTCGGVDSNGSMARRVQRRAVWAMATSAAHRPSRIRPRRSMPTPTKTKVTGNSFASHLKWLAISTPSRRPMFTKWTSSTMTSWVSQLKMQSRAREAELGSGAPGG